MTSAQRQDIGLNPIGWGYATGRSAYVLLPIHSLKDLLIFLLGAGPSRQTAALAGRLQVAPSTVSQEVKVDPDSPFDYQFPKVSAEQLKRIIHKLFDHPNMFTIRDCQRATAGCMLNYKQNARSTGNCHNRPHPELRLLCSRPETCRWSAKGCIHGQRH